MTPIRRLPLLIALALVGAALLAGTPGALAATAQEQQVVRLVNAARAQTGLGPLTAAAPLGRSARGHSGDMGAGGYFAHETQSTGANFMQRIQREPNTGTFRNFGETIGFGIAGAGTPAGMVRQWLASPPHRSTLLDPRFRRIGVGIWRGSFAGMPSVAVYTADFAG